MKFTISAAVIAILAAMPAVQAHMSMVDPPPILHKENPNTPPGSADSDYNSPISAAGFPCKGYHKKTGPEAAPVATWEAGSSQSFTIGGGAFHNGGSCQASISEDGGNTFKVVRSYIGSCPTSSGGTFDFTVPKETKSGPVLFSWTWYNNVGNREIYMNCAAIEISNGGSGLGAFPDIFLANLGDGCSTTESTDVDFPNPGPDPVIAPGAKIAPPVGSCQAPSGSPPTEQPPAVEPPAEEPPAEEPPVEEPPVEEPPAEEPPVEEPPVEEPPAEEPPVEEPPVEKPPVYVPPPQSPPPATGSCNSGEIICTSSTTWSLCAEGRPIAMGNTAAGTTCSNGQIMKRSNIRFSLEHMKRNY